MQGFGAGRQGFRLIAKSSLVYIVGNWSTHAFWSIGAIRRAGSGDDRYFGYRQHYRRSVDFLAQSGERVLQIIRFETHSASRRTHTGLVEDCLLGWFIAKKSNRHWARRIGTNHRGCHAATWRVAESRSHQAIGFLFAAQNYISRANSGGVVVFCDGDKSRGARNF